MLKHAMTINLSNQPDSQDNKGAVVSNILVVSSFASSSIVDYIKKIHKIAKVIKDTMHDV